MAAKKRLPSLFYNPVSMFGAIVAIVNFVGIVAIFVIDALAGGLAPYAGIIAFIILPAILLFGLVLIPIGMYFERRRRIRHEGALEPRSFYIDFGKPSHRLATMIFISGSIILLLATAVGSYRAYEFTESVTFCGRVCHKVMDPEYTAYQNSPHARVSCVDCHVGPGAGWFVKSKLSGAYQVYATIFNTYPRPIPTPVKNLRPAQETCEQCHWPDKFYASQEKIFDHYMVDEQNSKWVIRMLLKIGGGSEESGLSEGIHWHMNIANKIDYIATDEQRETIGWVRIEDRHGNVKEYMSEDNPISKADFSKYEMRRMDCIDCHNRPTHIYDSPSRAMNIEFTANRIDASLPYAKKIGVESLIEGYTTKDSAMVGISSKIAEFYESDYPEVVKNRKGAIDSLTMRVQDVYHNNFFPRMKVTWNAYPDHIGHFLSPGCFRCHDGRHVSEDGAVISNNCTSCHVIIAQGRGPEETQVIHPEGLEFKHPVDIGEAWKEMVCSDCHTGTSQL